MRRSRRQAHGLGAATGVGRGARRHHARGGLRAGVGGHRHRPCGVSPLCWFGVSKIKGKLGYDDALDVFGCHGIGGIWGGIATGLFASRPSIQRAQRPVLRRSRPARPQLVAIGVTIALAAVGTFVIIKFIGLVTKMRVHAPRGGRRPGRLPARRNGVSVIHRALD